MCLPAARDQACSKFNYVYNSLEFSCYTPDDRPWGYVTQKAAQKQPPGMACRRSN